ncbi:MAG: HAD-IA family hydrolase [Rhodocyclaceae bacterium]
MTIKNILFDADGVLQSPTTHWQPALQSVLALADESQAKAVLDDVFQAETEVLESEAGFIERLEAVLAKWGRPGRLSETLHVLQAIDVHEDIMHTVQAVRRAGIRCHIASNQQSLRARHMSEVLNYRSLFDGEFYSCFVGAAKPKLEFFETVVAHLGCSARDVLFLDDRVDNVEAAKRAGLNAMVFFGTEGAPALRHTLAGFGIVIRE